MRVLLISTYDLGRQPFGLASPAAWLRRAGHEVTCVDVTRVRLPLDAVARASMVGFFLPMHTATRLALPVMDKVRTLNESAHLVAYGLYAPLNADLLREHGIQSILGPEFEKDLVDVAFRLNPEATGLGGGEEAGSRGFWLQPEDQIPRLQFIAPDRTGLPPLTTYASLQVGDARKVVGYTEGSRGCKHLCRHCPIVPIYDGRFRIVSLDVVMADVAAQVEAGAEHITFGDPDFLNGPKHAMALVDALHTAFPRITYDVTVKVEHLIKHADLLPRFADTGCAFVTSAVESVDDDVLEKLEKGHTAADFARVVKLCRDAALPLSPTFVAFTPWTTLRGYCEFLHAIDGLGLVDAVSPIQYAIRMLIPNGSRMLELADVRARISHYDPRTLTDIWRHADPAVDALQRSFEELAGARLNAPRDEFFARVWGEAHAAACIAPPPRQPLPSRATVPYLNEPWYC
jgi:radical SAM superfamily enzyme YgiQ (UPF0313 family)